MRLLITGVLILLVAIPSSSVGQNANPSEPPTKSRTAISGAITGFRDPEQEQKWEKIFLAVPDPKLAEAHLRRLTAAPHIAGSPEDKQTAEYVAQKFRDAGLDTQIVEYKVWLNYPKEISVDLIAPAGAKLHAPSREHVEGDPYQDDPRVVTPVNGYSPSGDVEAEVVYANYGSPDDFKKLEELGIDVHGKIVLTRYGQNFRGVKVLVAQQHGAAGVIIYSDPIDDGYFKGDAYPQGPWRPATSVQRGSVGFMFEFPGDATTPGIAALPSLPDSQRTPPERSAALPRIPSTPLSYGDAEPILANLSGPQTPRDWQGALPFTYHLGPGPARIRMHLKQDYQYRTIWDVIGRVPGTELPAEWVVAGNHRDAWVYGAVDPNSGTTAMLEAVHGLGELLKNGWKPKRTLVFGSWDAEEQGLIGSTEWGEQHASELRNAVAYLNVDVAVSGPKFGASAVPSLKQFIRDLTKAVPSPAGGNVYDVWRTTAEKPAKGPQVSPDVTGSLGRQPVASAGTDVPVGDLGSGSDYTVFLQHLGVPSLDIGSTGDYGVYHSVFDNFQWFTKFGDPNFLYEQEMARVYGLGALRLANADVLPFDYETYGKEVGSYIEAARKKADERFGNKTPSFATAADAAKRLATAGLAMAKAQQNPHVDLKQLNAALSQAERGLLLANGLPNRPWYRHAIYAPGEYTGYAAVVIPGVNEAIDAGDLTRATQQISALTDALNAAARTLEQYPQNSGPVGRNPR